MMAFSFCLILTQPLFSLPNPNLQNIPPNIPLEHLDHGLQIPLRHYRVLWPDLAVPRLCVPVYLEFLDNFLPFDLFVRRHKFRAVWGDGDG
jgi:hypothetical protein